MLIDRYGRRIDYLRVSVTDRCNLRCEYCMPAEGTDVFEKGDVLGYEELERVLRVAARLGISRFRFTGGEPLIRRELPQFIARVRKLPGVESLAISTNGLLLAQQAEALRDAGVDKINISIDSWDRATFQRLTRRDVLPAVLRGLEAAARLGAFTIKINCVLLRGINDDVDALAALSERSFDVGVLPYYLHQLDRVQGSAHFEVSDEDARRLHEALAARLSGYLVPRLVREVAGDPGKRPL